MCPPRAPPSHPHSLQLPDQDWLAPVAPVVFPEECGLGRWQDKMPSCRRELLWTEVRPPPALAGLQAELLQLNGRRRAGPQPWRRVPPRQGFCIQGKLDPKRRSYDRIFEEMLAHKEQLLVWGGGVEGRRGLRLGV